MLHIKKQVRKGFTLIEILIVVAIIGLLMAFLAPRFLGKREQATAQIAQLGLRQVQDAINLYRLNTGRYPEQLIDLVEQPQDVSTAKKWQGPYVDDIPEDPWGQEYQYRKTPGDQHPYELYSEGPEDGEPISAWNN